MPGKIITELNLGGRQKQFGIELTPETEQVEELFDKFKGNTFASEEEREIADATLSYYISQVITGYDILRADLLMKLTKKNRGRAVFAVQVRAHLRP
ncbi:hypothetical protein [Tellurirhabdus bombi]|uniref:hypothetical protein n=1 Tax=Tellurirhabdus bombi TaxID=2907205 RepID=UPI001F1BED90|nr:hypothetical protein [Tellurirhabdus bombi]